MVKDNLAGLAKTKKSIRKPTQSVKTPALNVQKNNKTPEEERDIKAKEKVKELLQDIELTTSKNENEDERVFEATTSNVNDAEWLTEQLGLLSEQNEILRNELANAKDEYRKLYEMLYDNEGNATNPNNKIIHQNVLFIFNELQNNLLGNNPERTPWTTVSISHMLNKMLQMFSFLETHKKF